MAGGRPTHYTKWKAKAICMRIMMGESLRSICRRKYYPNRRTVFLWLSKNDEFVHQYSKAREIQQEAFFEDMLEIADDTENDYIETENGPRANNELVNRSRLRIDTRKWIMERMAPKKYGNKQQLDHTSSDGSMATYSPEDYQKAINSLSEKLK